MEYLIGSVATILVFLTVAKTIRSNQLKTRQLTIKPKTQAQQHSLVAPYIPIMEALSIKPAMVTQATKHEAKNYVRVILNENKAYWILDNSFLEADVVDGMVDKDSTKVVDIMAMDKVQLDKMIFIVEKLTEGLDNDFGSTRNS